MHTTLQIQNTSLLLPVQYRPLQGVGNVSYQNTTINFKNNLTSLTIILGKKQNGFETLAVNLYSIILLH